MVQLHCTWHCFSEHDTVTLYAHGTVALYNLHGTVVMYCCLKALKIDYQKLNQQLTSNIWQCTVHCTGNIATLNYSWYNKYDGRFLEEKKKGKKEEQGDSWVGHQRRIEARPSPENEPDII